MAARGIVTPAVGEPSESHTEIEVPAAEAADDHSAAEAKVPAAEAADEHAAAESESHAVATAHHEPVEITLLATEFAFTPSLIELEVDVPVRLTLVNEGAVVHDFSVPELPVADISVLSVAELEAERHKPEAVSDGHDKDRAAAPELGSDAHAHSDGDHGAVHLVAEPGYQAAIEFTPTTAGHYEVLCTVPCHTQVGEVIVTTHEAE